MEIVAALFVEGIDFRQVAGPATRIDITGAFFSTTVPAYPAQLDAAPRRAGARRRPTPTATATLETVFVRDDGTEVGPQPPGVRRRARQVRLPAGEGRARVRRAGHDRGPLPDPRERLGGDRPAHRPARCRMTRRDSLNPGPIRRRRLRGMDLVNRYAAALSLHPTPVEAVGEVAGEILERFDGTRPDLLVCFASPHHAGAFEDVVGGLRKLLEPDVDDRLHRGRRRGRRRRGRGRARASRCSRRASARAASTGSRSRPSETDDGIDDRRAGPTGCRRAARC